MTEEDEAFEDLAKRQGDWGMQGSRKHQIMRYAENVENKGTSMTDTCEKHCEATAFKIVIRGLEGEVAKLKERLADPMREVQRLGQEIEQEPVRLQCVTCGTVYADGVPPQVTQPEQEPVAWLDGPHLVVRVDMRDRLNYKGPWVDLGRAIPDKWTPLLFTTPAQRTEQEPVECRDVIAVELAHEERLVLRQAIWDSVEIVAQTTAAQRTEQNFCPRCGKRTADKTVIHTCTPPKENT